MTEAVPGASSGHQIKQESFGFFDSLDILATIATQELRSKNEEKVCSDSEFSLLTVGVQEETPDSGDTEYEDDSDGRSTSRGSVQPKKLAEMDFVNLEQIKSMSANTLRAVASVRDQCRSQVCSGHIGASASLRCFKPTQLLVKKVKIRRPRRDLREAPGGLATGCRTRSCLKRRRFSSFG